MKRWLIATIGWLSVLGMAVAQVPVGEWRSHFAYHNVTECVAVADRIYALSDGSLFAYYPEDDFIECFDKTNLLSQHNIRHIASNESDRMLVVIYDNAVIDLVEQDGTVHTLTDFSEKPTLDPMINDVQVYEQKAYLATNFGMSIVDLTKKEYVNTYSSGRITYSCVEYRGYLYAATAKGVYVGDTKENLLDQANWRQISPTIFHHLTVYNDALLALQSGNQVYRIEADSHQVIPFLSGKYTFMAVSSKQLLLGFDKGIKVFTTLTDMQSYTLTDTPLSFCFDGKKYFGGHGSKGLISYTYDKKKNQLFVDQYIEPNSPIRNHCQQLTFVDDDRLLVAGGCLNYFDNAFFDGTLMMYEGGKWSSFQEEGIAEATGVFYKNMTSIAQDPTDPTHHYASSFGQGIYEFRDMKFVKQLTDKNSKLESAVPGSNHYTRVCRLQYDKAGNLWISNGHAKSPLKLMKPDGTMTDMYYKELENMPTITDVLFASNGFIWVVSMRYDSGLLCINSEHPEQVKFFNENFKDQDGNTTVIYYINDIVEDQKGDIWLVTNEGPYVLFNTAKAFENDYHFNKIKVPRNDGTNFADYLLDGVYTTCIATDAANRKWIGTISNGVYLISEDGTETIHHFTVENSPLPSNVIDDIAINHHTGEVFIGTDKGLVSYMSDATTPEDEYNKNKVYAYPNPVYPDYNGRITVSGLKANSEVKVVSPSGQLVAQGTSLGGTFSWNGKNAQGKRVASGVYYVMASDESGKEGIVTKVLFLK